MKSRLIAAALALFVSCLFSSPTSAADLPKYIVPGQEQPMRSLEQLHALHHDNAFTACTLWDAWLPMSTVWTGPGPRARYRDSLLNRRIDDEGYVAMQQHRGMAHSDGWPFPAWQQSTGKGFHFSVLGEEWAVQNFRTQPLEDTRGWKFEGAEVEGIDPQHGLTLRATADTLTITTPLIRCGTIVAPFARLEWSAEDLPQSSTASIQWLLDGESDWTAGRSVPVTISRNGLQYVNVPLYRQPGYAGLLRNYRLVVDHAQGAKIHLKSIITAIDTRHPTTNWTYLQACTSYFNWSGDTAFLQANLQRMRTAVQYGVNEFSLDSGKHVLVPWVGHEGRTGLDRKPDGTKKLKPGVGVGNNYWDLLPFGAHDAMATMLAYDALTAMSKLEAAIADHPQWSLPAPDSKFTAAKLQTLTDEMRQDFQKRFWNDQTGRFYGWIDIDGQGYDYGFTFVNLEAIYYGLASKEQARQILDWVSGQRIVEGDTSTAADIYHWRLAPRATTKRNIETYVWAWSDPESIAWGNQVQDGGAVLGFSYHDLMARIKTNGPDDAWQRLAPILTWFDEVQAEGGYRAYYAKPGRGLLQGGGPPGGLGLDQEFLESVLVPQVMLYGFLGAKPTATGLELNPRLPQAWPSLTITNIHLHDFTVNITAHQDGRIEIEPTTSGMQPLDIIFAGKPSRLQPNQPLRLEKS